MSATTLARAVTLSGYFGLLILLLAWNTWLAPSRYFPTALVLIVLVVPLLVPLRGLLHGRVYTHSWVTFLAVFYMTLGIAEAVANPAQRYLAVLETVFSLMLLLGASWYARCARRQHSDVP